MLLVLTTTGSTSEAEALAEHVVASKLAACVQIGPLMTSVYAWEGEIKREQEQMLIIKTLPEKFDALEAFIRANHSYDVPEIVAVQSERVSQPYLNWVKEYLS